MEKIVLNILCRFWRNRKRVQQQPCFTADLGLAGNNNTAPSSIDGTYFRIIGNIFQGYKKYKKYS